MQEEKDKRILFLENEHFCKIRTFLTYLKKFGLWAGVSAMDGLALQRPLQQHERSECSQTCCHHLVTDDEN